MGGKIRWADTLDDDEGDIPGALPPNTTKGPDSHGVKIVTEYYRNERGDAFKRVTKTKVVSVEKKVYKVRKRERDGCARRRRRRCIAASLHCIAACCNENTRHAHATTNTPINNNLNERHPNRLHRSPRSAASGRASARPRPSRRPTR